MPYKDPELARKKNSENYLKNIELRKAQNKEWYLANREKALAKQRENVLSRYEEVKEYQKKYRQENKEKSKEYKRQYYLENKEKVLNKSLKYQKENPDKTLKRNKKYKKTEKGRINFQVYRNARRKRERHASLGGIFHKEILAIYNECKRITLQTGIKHEVDHIIPVMHKDVSGLHVPWNLQIIPAKANKQKTNKLVSELL
jgi:hypothetical protein